MYNLLQKEQIEVLLIPQAKLHVLVSASGAKGGCGSYSNRLKGQERHCVGKRGWHGAKQGPKQVSHLHFCHSHNLKCYSVPSQPSAPSRKGVPGGISDSQGQDGRSGVPTGSQEQAPLQHLQAVPKCMSSETSVDQQALPSQCQWSLFGWMSSEIGVQMVWSLGVDAALGFAWT